MDKGKGGPGKWIGDGGRGLSAGAQTNSLFEYYLFRKKWISHLVLKGFFGLMLVRFSFFCPFSFFILVIKVFFLQNDKHLN